MKKIHLILIDNHLFFRVNCRRLLEKVEDFKITGECGSTGEAIILVKERFPDVVILDTLFTYSTAVELIQVLKIFSPKTRYIILTSILREQTIRELLEVGIHGYVAKDDTSESLVPAIRSAMEGQIFLSPAVQKYYSRPFDISVTS